MSYDSFKNLKKCRKIFIKLNLVCIIGTKMSVEKEVFKIQRKLRKIASHGSNQEQALDLLKALRTMNIPLDILMKTRIGISVNELRKSSKDEELISLAQTLIENWRRLLPTDKGSGKDGQANKPTTTSSIKDKEKPSTSNAPSSTGNKGKKRKKKTAVKKERKSAQTSVPSSSSGLTDAVRLKCREMLCNASKASDIPEGCPDPKEMARELEEAIYVEFGNTDTKYKNRVRSRVFNLKDPKNPTLRVNYMRGAVTAQQLAKMTYEEMASDEMKKFREKIAKEDLDRKKENRWP